MIRLKELREKKNISQKGLAEIFNVAQNTISNWEKGTRKPDAETLIKLADYFEVSVDQLLGRTNVRTYPRIQAAHIDEEGPPVTEDALRQIEEIIKREREKIRREKEGK